LIRIPSSIDLRDDATPPLDPTKRKLSVSTSTRKGQAPADRIVLPHAGGPQDPRAIGAELTVYNAVGLTTDRAVGSLPAAGWSLAGTTGFA
jgi:hypothetical protein